METLNFNANIEADAIMAQVRQEQENRLRMSRASKSEFDPKKYLTAFLGKDETEKQMIIRLLPFSPEGGTPFHKVHAHTLKVNQEVAKSGWKTIVCRAKNEEAPEDKHCPFCEAAIAARRLAKETTDEAKKKRMNDIAFANSAAEMWVVRCIERGHEEDGVKFWMFPNPKNGGIYNQIMTVYNNRKEAGLRKGENRNIFDLINGKDLVITIKRGTDGKRNITVVDDEDYTPLTTDVELGRSWIQDSTKWTDLYPFKRVDYMSVLVGNGVPYFDKDTNTYVDKEEFFKKQEEVKQQKETEIESQVETIPDYTVPKPISDTYAHLEAQSLTPPSPAPSISFGVTAEVSPTEMPPAPNWDDVEDDLPF